MSRMCNDCAGEGCGRVKASEVMMNWTRGRSTLIKEGLLGLRSACSLSILLGRLEDGGRFQDFADSAIGTSTFNSDRKPLTTHVEEKKAR